MGCFQEVQLGDGLQMACACKWRALGVHGDTRQDGEENAELLHQASLSGRHTDTDLRAHRHSPTGAA